MSLNPKMLKECKDVIYLNSNLPESVVEPVHAVVKTIIAMEYSYEDFLSRELCGTNTRANVIRELILAHGGSIHSFDEWFLRYEGDGLTMSQKIGGEEPVVLGAWEA
jgi:hypothetical protein